MTTLAKIAIAITLSLLLTSCGLDFSTGEKGNGNITEQTREVLEDFTTIAASEGINVYVTQAEEFKIKVEADENIHDLIGTDIQNNTLKIHAIKNIGKATKNVYVSLPIINGLNSSSGAQLQTETLINTPELSIDASSGALVAASVTTDNISIDASSGANITLSGTVKNSHIEASSGANINASALTTAISKAQASSGANVQLNVVESLYADASSGANISYSGKATLSSKKSVAGQISNVD
tara:strand:+ start:83498 stop:84217 length:720 start_codon:yes stop_codon:yes gene_type:complete